MKILDTKPSVSDADISRVEMALAFSFPEDLKKHYLRANGGRPVPNLLPKGDEHFAVHEFLPILHGIVGARFEDTYRDLVLDSKFFPKNLVPFAIDAGGDYFCYSLEPRTFGQIFFYHSDYYDDLSRAVVFLSLDFGTFLNSLVSDDVV
jgi:cell wall assembly regulator SMI1